LGSDLTAARGESGLLRDALIDRDARRLLVPLLLWKLALLLLVGSCPFLLPGLFSEGNFRANFHWPADARPTLATLYETWDSQHFLFLSQNGYQRVPPDQAPFNAFYPLWPWLIRAFAGATPHAHLLAALLLSNLLSLTALLLFHRLVRLDHGEGAADAALVMFLAFPSAFVLALPYSESLFLLLAVVFFLSLRQGWTRAAALSGLLMPLTRALGVFLGAPLAVHLWRSRAPWQRYALLAAPALGFLGYLGVLYVSTGDPFTGFAVYRHYPGRGTVGRLWDLAAFGRALLPAEGLAPHGFTNSLIDRVVFVLFAVSLPLLWRLGPVWFAYALVAGLMPAMANAFMSYTRYALMVLPLFVAWGVALSRPRRGPLRALFAGILLLAQVLLLLRHVNAHWAG
jgi:hypothetical protein